MRSWGLRSRLENAQITDLLCGGAKRDHPGPAEILLEDKKPMSDLRDLLTHDVLEAAPRLLGCRLVRGDREALIVEVEAYRGSDDPGCHAFYGRTPRTEIMFGRAGLAYVYFTYGVHWMLNVVAHGEGDAAAILIRAAVPISGVDAMRYLRASRLGGISRLTQDRDLLSGPGKIAQAFQVDRNDYGTDLLDSDSELRIELGEAIREVAVGPRVGLAKGKGDELPWRFASKEHMAWVSAPRNRWLDEPEALHTGLVRRVRI